MKIEIIMPILLASRRTSPMAFARTQGGQTRASRLRDATMNLPVVGVVAANRISYVIGPDGRILYSYADSNPVKHVENTLSFVKRWREEHN